MLPLDKTLAQSLRIAACRLPLFSALALSVASPATAATWDFKPSWLDSAIGTPKWLTLEGDQRTRYEALG
ncbi:MAG: hypothetical protein L0H63_15610, partial [Nitrococcus sp.]|nr:hypothetical protein [Nitrococcus sp.]